MDLWGSESSDRTRRTEDWREETADRTVERACSACLRDDNWLRSSVWRDKTSVRSWDSRRRMAWWRCSAVEAGEPEERAAEEKEVEEKDEERKGERIGSLAKESKGEAAAEDGAVVEGREEEEEEFFRVERRCRGDAEGESADLCSAGAHLHGRVIKVELENDLCIRNTILYVYANCGFMSEE
ncbi:hypothetical protein GH714_033760 [Hevea brasiliensis]|uniref:Uncharacterized protein n=1 Tax=Hevea brasiliensis TaxID=3981 RepID=A0A6A6LNX9_HEVBR|nr:hypothetical protein GH714_033760 [Hevea brasiliensis]